MEIHYDTGYTPNKARQHCRQHRAAGLWCHIDTLLEALGLEATIGHGVGHQLTIHTAGWTL
jgi:hypothetical protein